MECYILILAATLCCASAALTVNAYDDDLELTNNVDNDQTVKSCDPRGCDALCRLLGFTDGQCVDGECKCERKEQQSQSKESLSPPASVDDCNYKACDQLCRRLGFPGGACVGDRCDCDNFKKSLVADEESEIQPASVDDCNYNACDQLCRRLGFPGGACVGDRCDCDNFKKSLDKELESQPAVEDCNYKACDQLCRRLGFPGGACVGGRCKCDNFIQSLVSLLNSNLRSCDWQQCNQRCRSHGLPGGSCFAGQCKCDTWPLDEENEIPVANVAHAYESLVEKEQKPDVSMRSTVPRGSCDCDPRSCDMYCFRIHYTGGICLTGSCRCYR